ncbi:MAG: hypothetical protein WDO68_04175 [Gammaproteobacteria bacterium]
MSITSDHASSILRQSASSRSPTVLTESMPATAISVPAANLNPPLRPWLAEPVLVEFADASWLRTELLALDATCQAAGISPGTDSSLDALWSRLYNAQYDLNAAIRREAIQPDRTISRLDAEGEEHLLLTAPQVQALLPEIINTVEEVLRQANDGLREAPVELQRPASATSSQTLSEQRLAACRRIVKRCGLILLGIGIAAAVVAGVAFLAPLAPVWCAVAVVATLAVTLPVGGVYAWKRMETEQERLRGPKGAATDRKWNLQSVQGRAEKLLDVLRSLRRDDVSSSSKRPDASAPAPESSEDLRFLVEAKSEPELELQEDVLTSRTTPSAVTGQIPVQQGPSSTQWVSTHIVASTSPGNATWLRSTLETLLTLCRDAGVPTDKANAPGGGLKALCSTLENGALAIETLGREPGPGVSLHADGEHHLLLSVPHAQQFLRETIEVVTAVTDLTVRELDKSPTEPRYSALLFAASHAIDLLDLLRKLRLEETEPHGDPMSEAGNTAWLAVQLKALQDSCDDAEVPAGNSDTPAGKIRALRAKLDDEHRNFNAAIREGKIQPHVNISMRVGGEEYLRLTAPHAQTSLAETIAVVAEIAALAASQHKQELNDEPHRRALSGLSEHASNLQQKLEKFRLTPAPIAGAWHDRFVSTLSSGWHRTFGIRPDRFNGMTLAQLCEAGVNLKDYSLDDLGKLGVNLKGGSVRQLLDSGFVLPEIPPDFSYGLARQRESDRPPDVLAWLSGEGLHLTGVTFGQLADQKARFHGYDLKTLQGLGVDLRGTPLESLVVEGVDIGGETLTSLAGYGIVLQDTHATWLVNTGIDLSNETLASLKQKGFVFGRNTARHPTKLGPLLGAGARVDPHWATLEALRENKIDVSYMTAIQLLDAGVSLQGVSLQTLQQSRIGLHDYSRDRLFAARKVEQPDMTLSRLLDAEVDLSGETLESLRQKGFDPSRVTATRLAQAGVVIPMHSLDEVEADGTSVGELHARGVRLRGVRLEELESRGVLVSGARLAELLDAGVDLNGLTLDYLIGTLKIEVRGASFSALLAAGVQVRAALFESLQIRLGVNFAGTKFQQLVRAGVSVAGLEIQKLAEAGVVFNGATIPALLNAGLRLSKFSPWNLMEMGVRLQGEGLPIGRMLKARMRLDDATASLLKKMGYTLRGASLRELLDAGFSLRGLSFEALCAENFDMTNWSLDGMIQAGLPLSGTTLERVASLADRGVDLFGTPLASLIKARIDLREESAESLARRGIVWKIDEDHHLLRQVGVSS